MAVTHYDLTATFTDLLGTAYSPTSAKVVAWIETNVASSEGIVDEVANSIALGGSRQVADSSGNVTWTGLVGSDSAAADINLESGTLQYRVTAEYVDAITRRRKTWVSGWFSLTADIDLADVISETYVPAAWMTTATATLQTYVDAGQAAATTAAAASTTASGAADTAVNAAGLASEIAMGDGGAALAAADLDPGSAFRVQNDARLKAAYTQKPTTDLGDWALLRRDTSDVTKGVAWTTPHTVVARVLGWRVVTDAQYAGGADPTGVADSLAAAQAAHDALPAGGGKLYYPEGAFKHSGAVAVTKPCGINGTGYGTDIKTSSATANIFTVSAQFVEMCGLRFTSSVVRTAGWYVDVLSTASRFRIENFSMDGAIGGIRSAAVATCTIDHGMILNCTAGTGVAVRIDDGVDITINDLLVDSATQIYSGVYITNAGDVQITDSQLIHAGDGLRLDAGVGDVISSVWSCNTFYDNCTNGVTLNAPGGSIVRSRFTSCWMSSSTEWGVKLASSAGGSIDGTDILGCHVFLNGSGGILLNDTGIHHTRIHDSAICENTGDAGILINAAVTDFSIIGNRIGDGYGFAGNGYGIYFNSASADYFQISNNDLTGNTVTNIGGTVPTAGANRIISDNLGDPTSGTVAGITVGASPFTHTAGPRYETVCINAGTVSLVKVDGTAVFQGTNVSVRLAPGKSVEVTYTVAPGMAAIRD